MQRGRFIVSSASAAALAACSSSAGFQPAPGPTVAPSGFTRLEITEFSRNAKLVASYRAGVAAMRAIADPHDERSWEYWHRAHFMSMGEPPPKYAHVWNQCKHHDTPYFYAWHRAFVYYFEQMVRTMSGDPAFTLPYWDYYKHPDLPAIFAEPTLPDGSANSLYWANRTGSKIFGMWYRPFKPWVKQFPNGHPGRYERLVEIDPHGFVHDEIGGDMGHVPTAALDPIFWAHHCNIDRLWSAWVAAGNGREMPPAGDPYYDPVFAFNLAGTWSMSVGTAADEAALGVRYSDLSLPSPPAGATLPARPPLRSGTPIALTTEPVSIALPAGSTGATLHLGDVRLSELGERGGFAIRVYVNLPERPAPLADEAKYAAGHVGSFGLSEARTEMKGMRMAAGPPGLALDLPEAAGRGEPLVVSFVPALAAALPRGALLAQVGNLTIA
jgi:tyrosinase